MTESDSPIPGSVHKFPDGGGVAGLRKALEKFDDDKNGTLNNEEFKQLIRNELKIGPEDLSDTDIAKLTQALDDDGSDSLSADEIYDFIEQGTATLFAVDGEDIAGPSTAAKQRKKLIDKLGEGTFVRLQKQLSEAMKSHGAEGSVSVRFVSVPLRSGSAPLPVPCFLRFYPSRIQ